MRVLLLAYHFPPIGGAGVQRAAKLVRYLPDFGWDAVVVTGPGKSDDRWTPEDETLAADVGEAEVHRVPGPEAAALESRLGRWLARPSAWNEWWIEGAVRAAREAGPVDLVLATMSPFESTVAAERIAAERRVPWVADLRDPWALDEMAVYPSALHRLLETRRMGERLQSAAAVVMNTSESANVARRTFPSLRTVHAVSNGFDESDFESLAEPRDDDAFRIVHTGYLHTALGESERRKRLARSVLGGAILDVDILTRSHLYLLRAIDAIKQQEPEVGHRIELHLAGVMTDDDRAVAARPYVKARGYLRHDESVALMKSADMLFLPMHDVAPGARARIVPAKTYEYLGAARPILAAVPGGDARELLSESGAARICSPADVEGLAAAIRAEIASPTRVDPATELLSRYTRRALAGDIAAILDATATPSRALAAA